MASRAVMPRFAVFRVVSAMAKTRLGSTGTRHDFVRGAEAAVARPHAAG